jgi:hypothetical protein
LGVIVSSKGAYGVRQAKTAIDQNWKLSGIDDPHTFSSLLGILNRTVVERLSLRLSLSLRLPYLSIYLGNFFCS